MALPTQLECTILAAVKQRGQDTVYKQAEAFTRAELIDRYTRWFRGAAHVEATVTNLFHRGCIMRAEDGHTMSTHRFEQVADSDHLVLTSGGDVALNNGYLPALELMTLVSERDLAEMRRRLNGMTVET